MKWRAGRPGRNRCVWRPPKSHPAENSVFPDSTVSYMSRPPSLGMVGCVEKGALVGSQHSMQSAGSDTATPPWQSEHGCIPGTPPRPALSGSVTGVLCLSLLIFQRHQIILSAHPLSVADRGSWVWQLLKVHTTWQRPRLAQTYSNQLLKSVLSSPEHVKQRGGDFFSKNVLLHY
jgi:hypothetical protein